MWIGAFRVLALTPASKGATERTPHWSGEDERREMMTEITRNGQTVQCHGEWREDSNCVCLFDDETLDGIYADGAESWIDVVEKLTAFALRMGTTLIELQAC
jgi:hypothetical protein